ncbi:MAG: prolipoprotein diacylglyceryl transferase family protein [Candidatus Omnitrophota bacterium]
MLSVKGKYLTFLYLKFGYKSFYFKYLHMPLLTPKRIYGNFVFMLPTITIFGKLFFSYQLAIVIGSIISLALMLYLKPRDFILSRLSLLGLGVVLFIAGFAGGRALFLLLHLGRHFTFSDIISFNGGYAYFGTLAFHIITLFTFCAITRKSFLKLMDYVIPFMLLAQAFVRIGCFMAGCCYGKPCNPPFGFVFKTHGNLLRYPTQLYECIILLTIFFIGRIIYEKNKDTPGKILFLSLFLYGVGRFFNEFLRVDSATVFMQITVAQITSLSLAIASTIGMIFVLNTKKKI